MMLLYCYTHNLLQQQQQQQQQQTSTNAELEYLNSATTLT